MLNPDPEMADVHISISDAQQQAVLNGLFVAAANHNNIEKTTRWESACTSLGGASIWDPQSRNLAQASISTEKGQTSTGPEPVILCGEIDSSLYDNAAKDLLVNRRPELTAT